MNLHLRTTPLAGLLFASCILMFAGCAASPEEVANGDDPIKALAASALGTRYQVDYWVREEERAPERYREAHSYCEGKNLDEYPNCREVLRAASIIRYAARPDSDGRGFTGKLQTDTPDSSGQP